MFDPLFILTKGKFYFSLCIEIQVFFLYYADLLKSTISIYQLLINAYYSYILVYFFSGVKVNTTYFSQDCCFSCS